MFHLFCMLPYIHFKCIVRAVSFSYFNDGARISVWDNFKYKRINVWLMATIVTYFCNLSFEKVRQSCFVICSVKQFHEKKFEKFFSDLQTKIL